MGQLVEQGIKTIFNGVSRQPDTVRLPGQVQEADNVLLSVVTGGFEKRPASQFVAELAGADHTVDYGIHVIDRDATEKYVVLITNGELRVYDALTGAAKTVNAMAADALAYLVGAPEDFAFVTVADYTFVLNRTVTVELDPATSGTITGYKKTFADLPATGAVGDIYKVTGAAADTDDYYVTWDAVTSSWIETVNPNGQHSFNAGTMPYQLVRESDGTFTFQKSTWDSRSVGDSVSVESPNFVGRTFSDIAFHRNRLVLIADENVFFSRNGDFFNLWPQKAYDDLDTDPIDVAASTNAVTLLRFAVPFRKTLFITSELRQFEVSGGETLTPKTAGIDLATSYDASALCRPVTMGDQLYFASKNQSTSIVREYFYEESSLSNTAGDITKHCEGYIPSEIMQMAPSATYDRLFSLTTTDPDAVYVYSAYWGDDNKKAQSAWCRWTFPGAYIHGIAVLGDFLYLVVRRGTGVYLEKVPVTTEEADANLGFAVLLDQRARLTGVYDAGNDWTTWTTAYEHDDLAVVVTPTGRELNVTYPTSTTIRAPGDFSALSCYVGTPYEMDVDLSKIYLRDENGGAIITGRLQLRTVAFSFVNSGYFEVHVTPEQRDVRVSKMTGRRIGSASLVVGSPVILPRGTHKVAIHSRADTVRIQVKNSTFLPCYITGAEWKGFYNDNNRQG